jgi:hypothetical protein
MGRQGFRTEAVVAVAVGAVALMAGATAAAAHPPRLVQATVHATEGGGTWNELDVASAPPARVAAAMAYDQKTGQMVLFGGAGPTGASAETWLWDGSTWSKLDPSTAPSPRSSVAMAYDPATGQIVLFGGFALQAKGPGFFSGTWLWDGTSWSLAHPATSPPPLAGASLSYDPATRQLVLFGGAGADGTVAATWAWDGSNWSELSPATSPPALSGAAMAWDQSSGELILFGGAGNKGAVSETWAWDGSNWSELSPTTSPPALSAASFAYDPAAGELLMFGGGRFVGDTQDFSSGTWAWDGSNWLQLSPTTSPAARSAAAMAYDPATNELVLFGGGGANGDFADTWAYLAPGAAATEPQATTTTTVAAPSTTPTSSPTSPSTGAPATTQPKSSAPTSTTVPTRKKPPAKREEPSIPHLLVLSRNSTGDGTVYMGTSAEAIDRLIARSRWEGKAVLPVHGQAVVVVVVGDEQPA